jgi:DNA-binding transcriptional MerR regulator
VAKGPNAFRTISEAADELGVPQHVLRFWETRFREIRPMKRGGGRRYYRPDDVDLLRGIRHLLYGEGYTIRGVQRILGDEGIKYVQTVWQSAMPQSPRGAVVQTADDTAEIGDNDEDEAPPERRGLRGRLTALIGEDLNERDHTPPRRDPPLQSAPEPHVGVGERLLPPDHGPPAQPQVAATVPSVTAQQLDGFPREDLRKLQAALHELAECRKLLLSLRSTPPMQDTGTPRPE